MVKKVKDSEILKEARRLIVDGQWRWICGAITYCGLGTKRQRWLLTAWINQMLGLHAYYDEWLRENHRGAWETLRLHNNCFREGRLAWLDWMIAECEKAEAA